MTTLGAKYQLGDKIGDGGMAEVYRAAVVGAEGFARPVAIKRVHASFSRDGRFGEMFVNEARIASLLHHANICSVLDFDRDDEGRYYLVMELVDGVDLLALLRTGRLPVAVTLHIVAELLKGLDYAHELIVGGKRLGIVHRDVSPHNVMLSWDGGVKLVDFGIAKAVAATNAAQSGVLKGKVGYMSPEQIKTEPLDGRSDLFAIGIMLHELLTAQRLFGGAQESVVLARVLAQPIARPSEIAADVPGDVDAVTMRLLERDRDRRFESAHQALEALLGCAAVTARGPLELRRVLQERFPDDAPARPAVSRPAVELSPLPAPVPPPLPIASTLPERPSSRPAHAEPAAPIELMLSAPLKTTLPEPLQATTLPEPTPHTTVPDPGLAETLLPAAPRTTVPEPDLALAATLPPAPRGVPARPPTLLSPPTTMPALAPASATTIPDPGATARPGGRRTALILGATVLACAALITGALWFRDRQRTPSPSLSPSAAPAVAVAPVAPDAAVPTSLAAGAVDAAVPTAAGADAAVPAVAIELPTTSSSSPPPKPRERRRPSPERPVEHAADARPPPAPASKVPGILEIHTGTWANVTVNGFRLGDIKRVQLQPGRYSVKLENDSIDKRETVHVTIESRKTTEIVRKWK